MQNAKIKIQNYLPAIAYAIALQAGN